MHEFCTFANADDFIVKDLKSSKGEQKFPFVIHNANPKIAEKINTFLQLKYLGNIPNSSVKNPFETVEKESRAFFESWEQDQILPKILALNMSGGGTGNYTSYFSNQESFDALSGNPILIEELFTPIGLLSIESIVNNNIRNTLREFIEESKPRSNREEDIETHDEQVDGYKQCHDAIHDGDLVAYYKFYFSKKSITFVKGACFPRVMRGLDDLESFDYSFSFEELQPYLSKHGEFLLHNADTTTGLR